jgi:hypothetical protein
MEIMEEERGMGPEWPVVEEMAKGEMREMVPWKNSRQYKHYRRLARNKALFELS